MTNLIITIAVLIAGSAFCSSSEAAIFSISTSKLESKAKKNKRYATLLAAKKDITATVGAIVIMNNIFNIAGTAYVGSLAINIFNSELEFAIFSMVLTVLIIIFGEIIPKNIGERFALGFGLSVGPILRIIRIIFFPVLWVLEMMNSVLFGERSINPVSEEEIKVLINQGVETRHIEHDEKMLIQNVFGLNDKSARDIMTPRVNVTALDLELPLSEQSEEIYNSQFSRLPVYKDDYDQIVGYVLAREVLSYLSKSKTDVTPKEFVNPIVKIKETTRVDSLLIMFQKKRQHIAVVVDEFGGTAGIVTLEDVLEQLVGEIVDETDEIIDMREVILEN